MNGSFSSPLLVNLFGTSSIGKTSTLDVLYSIAKTHPTFQLIVSQNAFFLFRYKQRTIGIITIGDPGCEKQVNFFLNQCHTHKCDRIFTCSRTRGSVLNMIISFANAHQYIYIETSPLHLCYPNGYTGIFSTLHQTFAQMLDTII